MKDTTSVHTAINRLMEAFPDVAKRSGKKTPARRLAFLFDQLRLMGVDQASVHDKVRWTGSIPTRGVKGWEEDALRWGRREA
jgi:hypothetical protein